MRDTHGPHMYAGTHAPVMPAHMSVQAMQACKHLCAPQPALTMRFGMLPHTAGMVPSRWSLLWMMSACVNCKGDCAAKWCWSFDATTHMRMSLLWMMRLCKPGAEEPEQCAVGERRM